MVSLLELMSFLIHLRLISTLLTDYSPVSLTVFVPVWRLWSSDRAPFGCSEVWAKDERWPAYCWQGPWVPAWERLDSLSSLKSLAKTRAKRLFLNFSCITYLMILFKFKVLQKQSYYLFYLKKRFTFITSSKPSKDHSFLPVSMLQYFIFLFPRVFCCSVSTRPPPLICQSFPAAGLRPWTTSQSASWFYGWRAAKWRGVSTVLRGTAGAGGQCGWTWCRHLWIVTPLLSWAGRAPGYEGLYRVNGSEQ